MQARLITVGTGTSRHVYPRDPNHYEGGRRYVFPMAGEVKHYGNRAVQTSTQEDKRYGLMIIDDRFYRIEEEAREGEPQSWKDKIEDGRLIARGLAQKYSKYGVTLIKGETPTEEELERAWASWRAMGAEAIDIAERNYAIAKRTGKGRAFHSRNAKAWAAALGVQLSDSTNFVQKEPERVACPKCSEQILPTAKLCKECGSSFGGKTALEAATEPEQQPEPPKAQKAPKAAKPSDQPEAA